MVDATNDPPVPTIDTPSASLTWNVGDTISFSGSRDRYGGRDDSGRRPPLGPADGALPGGLPSPPAPDLDRRDSGSFVAPDHEYPSHLELRLTATDSHGASTTSTVELMPNTSVLSVTSSPAGVPLTLSGTTSTGPASLTVIRDGAVTVAAPLVATISGARYRFDHWTDSLQAVHDVVVAADTSLVASYVRDAPDTCAAATAASRTGSWVQDYLSGNGDDDWFRFTLTAGRRVLVTLGNLPANARLELYSSCATRLATVATTGARFEELTRPLAAGTYRVHVTGSGGARSSLPYAVRFQPMAPGIGIVSSRVFRSGTSIRIVGDAINDSGGTRGQVTVTATFLSSSGRVVGRLTGLGFATTFGNGGRTSFRITGSVGTYRTMLLTATSALPVAVPSIAVSWLRVTAGAGGAVLESGAVLNRSPRTARWVRVARTWYDAYGSVLDVGWAAVSPATLGSHRYGTFSLVRPTLTGVAGAMTETRAVY